MKFKFRLILSVTLFAIGIISLYFTELRLISEIAIVVGLQVFIFSIAFHFVFRKKSINLLGVSLIAFSNLYLCIHYIFFIFILRFQELYDYDPYLIGWITGQLIVVIIAMLIFFHGCWLIKNYDSKKFNIYIRSNIYRTIIGLILILLILELPIFGIHGDFGGIVHGHSIWNSQLHMH